MKRGLFCLAIFMIMLVCFTNATFILKGVPKKVAQTINSLGNKVNAQSLLTKYPWTVDRCDQIIVVKAKYIPDFDDYTVRKDAWFVITAYQISMFTTDKADSLQQNGMLSETKFMPAHLNGSGNCIQIDGGSGGHNMALCVKTKKEEEALIVAVKEFYDCRGGIDQSGKKGKNLKKKKEIDVKDVKKLLKSCNLGKFKGAKDLNKKLQEEKKKLKEQKAFKPTGWFAPSNSKVPGSK